MLLEKTKTTIRVLDNSEENLHKLRNRFKEQNKRLRFLLGDVRDYDRLARAMEGVDAVYHLAASKHVWIGEFNPMEVKSINVDGTQNVIDATLDEKDIQVFMFTSSDKAVRATNFYGKTKAMCEDLVLNAEKVKGDRPTAFSVYRPGNFFMSSGNVITTWISQLEHKEAITLTNGNMRRYFIGVGKAAELLYEASLIAQGGDIFIPAMREYSIKELGELFGGEIELIDPIEGEKEAEELYTDAEAKRLEKHGDLLWVKPK